ncbi:hypothetical protein, partial [Streptosporangium canum]|uniref:hypothetical protein n=1 Tax=Streptosporangium canum TaxID=324952 RepID=UPI003791DA52
DADLLLYLGGLTTGVSWDADLLLYLGGLTTGAFWDVDLDTILSPTFVVIGGLGLGDDFCGIRAMDRDLRVATLTRGGYVRRAEKH